MRRLLRWPLYVIALVAIVILGMVLLGPYEKSDLTADFHPNTLGNDLDAYFASVESRFDDITSGVEKRVVWADGAGQRKKVALLYIHGFSATSEEIRPVPERIAKNLNANLVYTRLRGHGRGGAALADATVRDWMHDVAEGLASAQRAGEKVIVLATSTGATLAVAAATKPELSGDVAGMVLVSPNFGINNRLAPLLTWPAARYWLPLLAGHERSFEPANDIQAKYWTTRYPSVAVMPMAALVKRVSALEFDKISVPALFWYSDLDKVVRADITKNIAAQWGGTVTEHKVQPIPGTDRNAHVVTGDALSPGQTDIAVLKMTNWIKGILQD